MMWIPEVIGQIHQNIHTVHGIKQQCISLKKSMTFKLCGKVLGKYPQMLALVMDSSLAAGQCWGWDGTKKTLVCPGTVSPALMHLHILLPQSSSASRTEAFLTGSEMTLLSSSAGETVRLTGVLSGSLPPDCLHLSTLLHYI